MVVPRRCIQLGLMTVCAGCGLTEKPEAVRWVHAESDLRLTDLAAQADGGVLVAGHLDEMGKAYVASLDGEGQIQWEFQQPQGENLPLTAEDWIPAVAADARGGAFALVSGGDGCSTGGCPEVLSIDSSGDVRWRKRFDAGLVRGDIAFGDDRVLVAALTTGARELDATMIGEERAALQSLVAGFTAGGTAIGEAAVISGARLMWVAVDTAGTGLFAGGIEPPGIPSWIEVDAAGPFTCSVVAALEASARPTWSETDCDEVLAGPLVATSTGATYVAHPESSSEPPIATALDGARKLRWSTPVPDESWIAPSNGAGVLGVSRVVYALDGDGNAAWQWPGPLDDGAIQDATGGFCTARVAAASDGDFFVGTEACDSARDLLAERTATDIHVVEDFSGALVARVSSDRLRPYEARCGNGWIDPGEDCDGALLSDGSCRSVTGVSQGELRCGDDCRFDTSDCVSQCGDGKVDVERGEECDGDDLNGRECGDVIFGGPEPQGRLRCTDTCQIDESDCDPLPEGTGGAGGSGGGGGQSGEPSRPTCVRTGGQGGCGSQSCPSLESNVGGDTAAGCCTAPPSGETQGCCGYTGTPLQRFFPNLDVPSCVPVHQYAADVTEASDPSCAPSCDPDCPGLGEDALWFVPNASLVGCCHERGLCGVTTASLPALARDAFGSAPRCATAQELAEVLGEGAYSWMAQASIPCSR